MMLVTLANVLCILILLFCFYKIAWCSFALIRNNCIYNIRINWINTNDQRHSKYTYTEMIESSEKKKFGWTLPIDSDFT